MEVSVTTDKLTYGSGEPIVLTLEVANHTDETVTFEFSSGQRYDFTIVTAAGNPLWRWSVGMAFIQMLGQESIRPGQSLTYRQTFEGELAAGSFEVIAELVATNYALTATTTVTVH